MRLTSMILILAAGCVHGRDHAEPRKSARVDRVILSVSSIERAEAFFSSMEFAVDDRPSPGEPSFETLGLRARTATMRLGDERIELMETRPAGRPVPADSKSNDLWFEHIAIVVSDMDCAVAVLSGSGALPISNGPQTIPASNPSAGGIRAYYFRDPDGHALELIWFPPGRGREAWQRSQGRLFLGIDHTAIAVASTAASLRFYRDQLGLDVRGESLNFGIEQEQLSAVPGAKVRITGMSGATGLGVELLEYLEPGPGRIFPPRSAPNDLWHWEIVVAIDDAETIARELVGSKSERGGLLLDPSGHAVRLVDRGRAQ
jgi:catechol 2,3-dioxygenase-like lactoylglutathione lyase family enzyme